MTDLAPHPPPPSRDERLAAKLRENLRRRKAQARAQAPERDPGDAIAPPGSPPLSNTPAGG